MDAPGPDGDPPAPALVPPTFDQIDFNELTTHEALGEIWHRISAIMQYLIGKDQERDIKTDRLITNINNGFARVSREAKARDLNAKNRIRNSHVYGDNDQLYPLYNTSTGLPIPSLPTRKSELQGCKFFLRTLYGPG